MNMHGVMTAGADEGVLLPPLHYRVASWLWVKRWFLMIVVVPMLICAGYLYLFAADQYESEAHFIVHSAASTPAQSSGLGGLLGLTSSSSAENNAGMVADYLQSHDAVNALQRQMDLIAMFRRPEADAFSELGSANPTPENLLKYYLSHVEVKFNQETGIATLTARAFTPQDSYRINKTLLALGEQRVNEMNTRSYNDSVSMARQQLNEAENGVADIQSRMTAFRQTGSDLDPQGSGEAQIHMVSTLEMELSTTRAQLNAMRSLINSSSPQFVAMAARVRALEAEVAGQSAKMTGAGAGTTIAKNLGGYEDLKIRQDFAAKRYDAAAADLEKARADAQRQQLYVVRIVEPNMPVKALYPQRLRVLITLAVALLLAYGIGWLIIAGVREHEA